MSKSLQRSILPIVVFITGASVLIVEVVAVRVLSPYYGNTIFTVSSVISVILLALSFGYYLGGKLADWYPTLQWFFGIILVSGSVLLLFYSFGSMALPILSLALSITIGPLISAALLFLLPALLLGTLSPYAVKLQSVHFPEQGIGSAAGTIFFWSTLGSIVGSLAAGFVLIPNFGIDQILIATGVGLFLLGLIPLLMLRIKKEYLYMALVVLAIVLGVVWYANGRTSADTLYSKDGVYEKISIYDGTYAGRPTRFFQQDRSLSGAMFLDSDNPTDLVYDYTKYYSLYKLFTPRVKNALVIGGGAYSIPKALVHELPEANVDVAEIEPSLFDLAKEYFQVSDTSRMHNFVEDGRRFLRDTDTKYDFIFSDVYYSLFSVPPHFTTKEFFTVAKDKLSPDGVFIASMIGDLSRQQPSLIMAEIKTFQSVFPNSYFFAVETPERTESQNIIFVGYNSDEKINVTSSAVTGHQDPILRSLQNKIIDVKRFDLSPYPILTDNFSPVEYLTAQVLQRSFEDRPFIDGNEMLAVIDQQLRYGPRYLSAPGHKKVQDFLIAEMKELTQEVKTQIWKHTATDGKTYELTNVIGRLYPTQERRIVLAAHYDSKRFADKDKNAPDQPVPGANDSASGVAALVELTRKLGTSHVIPNVGVDIVFFDGEEGEEDLSGAVAHWKPLGSTYFAEHLQEVYGDKKPVGGIVLDMVCDTNLNITKEQTSVKDASAHVDAFWNVAQKVNSRIFQNRVGPAMGDDHSPLNKVGVPSFLVIDFDYPYFHTTEDTLDKCSAESMEAVSYAVLNYLYSIQ